jgi:serine phosphatase RsbU (regulator of sigma subunit)/anti-sigma regulatory factor (Ser/Thr protein kinase)
VTSLRTFWRNLTRSASRERTPEATASTAVELPSQIVDIDLELPANDPLGAYLQSASGVVDLEALKLDSPALDRLREAGASVVVPLVSQGELVGLIALGGRLSEQDYSADDRKLLADLATQAAPAVRVAQLVRQQRREALERGRVDQELRVAGVIQQSLLPKGVPELPGWRVAVHYQPAREVGGDFYEFLHFDDGRIAFIVGDVTDKGVPAAMVMATTRSLMRAVTERLTAPGAVLERVNELLQPDIPERMFVTCFYALLDPATGVIRYANAGHDLPYRRGEGGVDELHARGMPLGLMPDMLYEEAEMRLAPGDTVLFHSDGLVEAHDPERAMFGFPRLKALMGELADGEGGLIPQLLERLATFTGPGWEQEDDVTLVTLHRSADVDEGAGERAVPTFAVPATPSDASEPPSALADAPVLDAFDVASEPGNERGAAERVVEIAAGQGLDPDRLEKLKTAVAEATMNAMEHGNGYDPDLPVTIRVAASETDLHVSITDLGDDAPESESEAPDLEAKLAGEQSPRGWGLFLIRNMVDEMRVSSSLDAGGRPTHTIELIVALDAEPEAEAQRDGAHDHEIHDHAHDDEAHEGGA